MKHKLKNPPKFYAFYHSFNGDELKPYNIITESLIKDMVKNVGKKYYDLDTSKYDVLDSKKKFMRLLEHELMYRYWSKCEWEFICSNWTGKDFEQKVDVYDQLKPNLEVIADLLINALCINWDEIKGSTAYKKGLEYAVKKNAR